MSFGEDLIKGLQEILADAQGKSSTCIHHVHCISDIEVYAPDEIKVIRVAANMEYWLFAGVIGVKIKTVKAWENGHGEPSSSARRIIGMLKAHPNFPQEMGLYVVRKD